MRLKSDDSLHLTYCSNIHPGESWMEIYSSVELYAPVLRRAIRPEAEFGIGLRLSDRAAREMLEGRHLQRFRRWLDEHGLYVFTLNGFPYGGFHRTVVKDDVYRPDWTSDERVAYTHRLAEVLAAVLPDGIDGGISTSPVSYKYWHSPEAREDVFRQSAYNLAGVAAYLDGLRARTGHFIHLDIEPEPDCLIENGRETVDFFERFLLPLGSKALMGRLGISPDEAQRILLDHIQVCFDSCHFAVEYEDPAEALAMLTQAGLKIGKLQISSALSVSYSKDEESIRESLSQLSAFSESTYLHQVVERRKDGTLRHFPDLPDALATGVNSETEEWRIHYHVPVFVEHFGTIRSTREDLVRCLQIVKEQHLTAHLEIETYTWEVLPDALKLKLSASIAREYDWVLSVLEPVPESVDTEDKQA